MFFLWAAAVSGVLTFVAIAAGWIVTEVGRQPWIIYNVMRTEDAVTAAGGIWVSFAAVATLYAALGIATVVVLRAMSARWRRQDIADESAPYGPRPAAEPAAGAVGQGGP